MARQNEIFSFDNCSNSVTEIESKAFWFLIRPASPSASRHRWVVPLPVDFASPENWGGNETWRVQKSSTRFWQSKEPYPRNHPSRTSSWWEWENLSPTMKTPWGHWHWWFTPMHSNFRRGESPFQQWGSFRGWNNYRKRKSHFALPSLLTLLMKRHEVI